MIIGQTYTIKTHPEVYPYLVTFIVPDMYHIIVLPEGGQGELMEIVRKQMSFNRLKSCLVLGPRSSVFLYPDGREVPRTFVPRGGTIYHNILKPCKTFFEDRGLKEREEVLDRFIRSIKKDGQILGDLSKGGRKPTPEEAEELRGLQKNGVPKGLLPCPRCGEWRGECLDSILDFGELVVQVHCVCQNDNRCAGCGELLAERKLNSNYYNPRDGRIWHYPGFVSFKHTCKQPTLRLASSR